MNTLFGAAIIICLTVVAQIILKRSKQQRLPVPPGPPRRWLVGNLLDIPKERPWEMYREWCHQYGDVVFLDLFVRPMVVLGSIQAVNDLLDVRSNIYSSRPPFIMIELLTWDWTFSMMPYGHEWRTRRRYFREYYGGPIVKEYHAVQLQETRLLLQRIVENPESARHHIRNFTGSTIIRVTYGARSASQTAEYVQLAENAMEPVRSAMVPGAFMAELFPFLKHIPGWLPGGGARKFSEGFVPIIQELRNRPYEEVLHAAASGNAIPSVSYSMIRRMQGENESEITSENDTIARDVTGTAYAAASDTTTAALETCVIALALFPEVQKKAQAQLDLVVGSSRLPEFDDLDKLTYIQAVTMECLRWMPIAPVGIPHCLFEDDEYNGYFIPKGTMVVANIWSMLHNPEDYPDPDQFRPERYIGPDGKIDPAVRDPRTIAFGFGRRICPGLDFAISMLTISIASMLHVFKIEAGVDDDGKPIVLSSDGGGGAISAPSNLPRILKPRSEELEKVVREQVLDYDVI